MAKFSPNSNKAHDLGASDKKWNTLHVGDVQSETATISGNVLIQGNLTVEGEATEITLETLAINNPMIKVGEGNVANSSDLGFYGQYDAGAGARFAGLAKDASVGKFKLSDGLAVEPTTTFDGSASGVLVASSFEGALVGNASSASQLQTTRAISFAGGDVSGSFNFNGSADVSNIDLTIGAGVVENSMLAGSIANNKLANSSVSFGGVTLSLGQSDASPAFDLQDATGYPTAQLVGDVQDAQLAQDYVQVTEVDNSSVEWSGTALRVKASGITNTMLAGSIADNKLAQDYIQTSEVDDASIEWDGVGGHLQVKASGITNAMLAGSIENGKLVNSSVSFGGVSLALGQSDASPAFNLADATGYPTSSLVGTIADNQLAQDYIKTSEVDNSSIEWHALNNHLQIKAAGVTNAMLAGSIENNKLSNSSISFGGVSLALGQSDASPAFNLIDATGYPTSSLVGTIADNQLAQDYIKTSEVDGTSIQWSGTQLQVGAAGITNSMLAGSIENNKLSNSSVSFGGVTLSLGGSDASPAFNLADATGYPTSSLVGSIADGQLAQDYIKTSEVDNSSIQWDALNSHLQIKASGVTNAMLAGSIENGKLVNSTVSFGGVSLALGQSDASPAFNLVDATGYPTSSLVGSIADGQLAQDYIKTSEVDDSSIQWSGVHLQVKAAGVTNAMLAGSIANNKLSNSTITLAGGTNGSGTDAVALGETLTINGTSGEIDVAVGANALTIGLPNNVNVTSNLDVGGNITISGAAIISGNLNASGQVTASGANISFADSLIEIGVNNTNSYDVGFYGQRGDGAGGSLGFAGVAFDESADEFIMFTSTAGNEPTTTVGTHSLASLNVGGLKVGTMNYPATDGVQGQVLSTNGDGDLLYIDPVVAPEFSHSNITGVSLTASNSKRTFLHSYNNGTSAYTLPRSVVAGTGYEFIIRNSNSGINTVTIYAEVNPIADSIWVDYANQSAASISIAANETVTLVADGNGKWYKF